MPNDAQTQPPTAAELLKDRNQVILESPRYMSFPLTVHLMLFGGDADKWKALQDYVTLDLARTREIEELRAQVQALTARLDANDRHEESLSAGWVKPHFAPS